MTLKIIQSIVSLSILFFSFISADVRGSDTVKRCPFDGITGITLS